jgi:glyoxylase-like metal-dependent hydrolase (beta-lactamase superfamily II)
MKISIIHSGLFKLDGGAMFGVVPKQLWTRKMEADEKNMCTWCMRSLLIETGDRKILVDTGIGDKQDEKFRSHFHPHGPQLIHSLKEKGLSTSDITDVFLTHFHFDHVGGAVSRNNESELVPTFPNARYWTNKEHYDWAYNPNAREAASYLKENFVPLETHGVLNYIEGSDGDEWVPDIRIRYVNGHTRAMMLLDMNVNGQRVLYAADLIPSYAHVSLPWVMAYDVEPLKTLEEKERILNEVYDDRGLLLFEHDAQNECASLTRDQKGRIRIDDIFSWTDVHP